VPEYILREMTVNDHQFIYKLVEEYLRTDFSVTVLALKSFDEYFKAYSENDLKTYIIIINDERAGFVHITKDGEIGYYLTKKYQNKGVAVAAVNDMLKLHPKERYFATVNINNIRSNNLVKKLGFKPKGIIYEKKNKA